MEPPDGVLVRTLRRGLAPSAWRPQAGRQKQTGDSALTAARVPLVVRVANRKVGRLPLFCELIVGQPARAAQQTPPFRRCRKFISVQLRTPRSVKWIAECGFRIADLRRIDSFAH